MRNSRIFNPYGLNDFKEESSPIKNMVKTLHHRGPDEQGILFSRFAHLGHARLSIVDIKNGQQPMVTKDKNLAITYNGEIYNHPELRNKLINRGYKFETKCDTEVLLYLYQEYKEDLLPMLNGQFAFALIDFKNKSLFLAKDRVGIRPLFYAKIKNTIYFASSIKSLFQNSNISKDFNYKAYYQLISLWSPLGDNTFFKSISSLEPGNSLKYDRSGVKKKTYWDITFPSHYEDLPLKKWKSLVRKTISESVRYRLRADVPISGYLSGGLDSCIILDLVKKSHNYPVESFSVTFDNLDFDESEFQSLMANYLNCKNYSEKI